MNTITIQQPNDMHIHFRDGIVLSRTVNDTAAVFKHGLIMPNLQPPITSIELLKSYRDRILAACHYDNFIPLMTLYLTESMTPRTIKEAATSGLLSACKYYPAGATTGSDHGVRSLKNIIHLLDVMQENDIILCLHGENIDPHVDVFDREARFIDQELHWLIDHYPNLRVILEHISTKAAVEFVIHASNNIAATITPQHLLCNRNDMLRDGIKPDLYCKPILKTLSDQQALAAAALSENPKFFLGTDSAPHTTTSKYTDCGCAGCYSAYHAIELYAEFFHQHHAMEKLNGFASIYGAQFYHLPIQEQTLTLVQQHWQVPERLNFGNEQVTPFYAGHRLHWKRQ